MNEKKVLGVMTTPKGKVIYYTDGTTKTLSEEQTKILNNVKPVPTPIVTPPKGE